MKRICQALLMTALGLMLWPALTYAAPPDPKGALVYTNDFNTQAETAPLETVKTADYETGTHAPGVVHIRVLKSQTAHSLLLPKLSYGQFSLNVEVWDNSDDFVGDTAYGVVFRAQDANHLYAVLIDPRGKEGQYAIRKLDGANNWSDLVAWKPSPLIQQKSLHNQLRVDADGANFTVYLNGQQLDSASDSAYAGGGLGFIVANLDANQTHMHFDNLKIYSTEGTALNSTTSGANSPSTLPSTGLPIPYASVGIGLVALGLLTVGAWLRRRAVATSDVKVVVRRLG